tara:strand:+ start:4321 stop:4815 length:495 start_codon:yes stop_codon:yes gene_type:complete
MSTLKTHNLQSPDAGSVNIALAPNAGMIVAGLSTYSNQINVGSNIKLGTAGVVTATSFVGSGANLTSIPAGNLTGTVADARISTLTASKLTGALPAISGANLTNLPPSAPVGGASTNQVFFENDKLVEVGYQITSTKNAMSAGPVSISAGIAVTVPSGCSWTIV